ncbi:EAL domain-containing protein [Pseudobacteriovorax antillogorgiicola]|uniref:EAL domain, c-di-GMP-specific phosphodiesterase class I (Or its enzymatically inactive variant) n=1 Tax=Pseudobacteriovorax antillogorgiicola TaxID=1513793 RepID=A0A1Y6CA16_9BACT|nr:EAL domain-containing protein [Pseudobacteriovorax antillogorgiicola]TCS51785.1 EAL domain-containing protein (putative c-di-GMP-specific phosphodiesterase class I) [Pseudobacteriovorax antillogorgiicola]SMF49982.1 EAL domain, c-di-GMP-specific phosphodiesterase class I (or its enzymatically inactive variant) [Pseudobacteriovorax antillogorgiicola]
MLGTTKKRRYSPGEVIFSQGDSGNCAFIIEMGRVEVFVTSDLEKVVLANLGVGEIFGEMSVLDGSPRSASAVALESAELAIVSNEAISERFEAADPIVRLLITMLLKHVRFSNRSVLNQTDVSRSVSRLLEADAIAKQKHEALDRLRLESDLKQGLQEGQFQLHFQPIVNMLDRQLVGFESLIRWHSPNRGLVRPDVFIGIAEETSLIVPIGRWVIEQACKHLSLFKKQLEKHRFPQALFMSINISGRQFQDPHFFNHLLEAIKETCTSPKDIKLEVTERTLMQGASALHMINKSRKLGFQVALDDFGTGYSSLSYLSRFEVDNLKVDQSFVRNMNKDRKVQVITKAIIDMAMGMGLPSIAEGIETEGDFETLKQMGCEFGQGYLFAKPLSYPQAISYLLKQKETYGFTG